jgi:hypothetical protein
MENGPSNALAEDWELLMSFFPSDWKEQAEASGALRGLRQDKSAESYLRVLLMHLGCGFSLRETIVRAKQAQLADLSDVALLKRLRKSKPWLHQLCCSLFAERALSGPSCGPPSWRLIDASLVSEPGKTGSQWRVHYSLRWPSLECDYFKLTPVEGPGHGESLYQFAFAPGDFVLADRGYCHAQALGQATRQGAFLTVRLNPQGIRLQSPGGDPYPLVNQLQGLQGAGQTAEWEVRIPLPGMEPPLPVRLCAVRKSAAAIVLAQKKLWRKARKEGWKLQPESLIYAQYVMVLSTFPPATYSAQRVLEAYRLRWQVELVFKRLKQIAQLGHLPKHDKESSQAWLYGKLLVALLTEKVIQAATTFSPWGYDFQEGKGAQSLA